VPGTAYQYRLHCWQTDKQTKKALGGFGASVVFSERPTPQCPNQHYFGNG